MTQGLSNTNANLAYSSIFGDRSELDEETYDYFKLSGVAHLLAVSGLHVGILVLILNKVFDGLRLKRWLKLIFLSIMLILYSYLCGFTTSVVRASIMAICLVGARTLFKEYDSLSSKGVAGIILFVCISLL